MIRTFFAGLLALLILALSSPYNLLLASDGNKPKSRVFRFSAGMAIPTGTHLRHVYSGGLHFQGTFFIPAYKGLNITPLVALDYYGKNLNQAAYNRSINFFLGIGASYSVPLSKKNHIFFTPALSGLYGFMDDEIGPRSGYSGAIFPILSAEGLALDVNPSFIFERVSVGLSYLFFRPKIQYSQKLKREVTRYNELHELYTIEEEQPRFNFSSIRISLGYSF